MDLEIISREYIKPSSPTPSNLRTHNLCLIDQLVDHIYASQVNYYPLSQEINLSNARVIGSIVSERLLLLKQSLSETLTHRFYPLAGKLKHDFTVDCNDEGVYFAEARAKSTLNEFLSQPDVIRLIPKLVPRDGAEQNRGFAGAHVAKIQVTVFSCGGLAICTSISHMFSDGTTLALLLNNWAAIARKNIAEVKFPIYDTSSLFHPADEDPKDATCWRAAICDPFLKTGRGVTRRFVFDAKALANLRAKATSLRMQNPTRVEAVSAFLFRRITLTFRKKSGFDKPNLLTHLVNLRRKVKPQISDCSVGNILWHANALCTEDEVELDGIVYRLREALTRLNGDFVKNLQGDDAILKFQKVIQDEGEVCSGAVDRIMFSSWRNFCFYDIDFGWGKPIWVSSTGSEEMVTTFINFISLIDTRLGDGIEAWVLLHEEDMALLELDKELLAFATMDPNPLDI
ncbi:vinorine synthase-like [Melia azedarach]|uniref:Vinorine synthase-like n=1 Tax=Melia azedarach TaxID=155640 RepID=A0ACC1XVD4_MELAZ|nr:vinorine synthase-like [Melia azedarach]